MANGTPPSAGFDFPTKVISGCTEATLAPFCLKLFKTSLLSAPLEWNATLPFHEPAFEKSRAAPDISESGTQNQTTSAERFLQPTVARDRTRLASARACLNDGPGPCAKMVSMANPARAKATASVLPKFPGPTIAIVGLARMPGSITDGLHPSRLPSRREPSIKIFCPCFL
jgi:hypothetical protein